MPVEQPGKGWRRGLVKYGAVAAATLRSRFAYLGEVVAGFLFMVAVMIAFAILWRATFAGQQAIDGYTLPEMIWYLVATEALVMGAPRVHLRIDADVKSGDLAYWLSRPLHYLGYQYAMFLAEALVGMAVCFALGGAVAAVAVGGFTFRWEGAPAVLAAVILSQTVHFLVSAAIGLSAFWLEDVRGLYLLVDRTRWILGGLLIPMEVLPDGLRAVARHLPFQYLLAGPATLLVHFSWGGFWDLAGRLLLWLAAAGALVAWIWHRAERRVAVHGG